MKILIIDDERKKFANVSRNIIDETNIDPENIECVLNLNDARQKLRSTLYDFLILDLNLPDDQWGNPQYMAGKEFIDEIINIDSYIKPIEIIVLTEYEEQQKKFMETNGYYFTVLKYDSLMTEWSDIICGKVKYILAREKNKKQLLKADVVLITAVKVETDAVKKLSNNWKQIKVPNDPNIYFKTHFDKELIVIHAQQSEMGMTAAATLTTKMIYNFSPKYVIMPGIAAGVGKSNNFGDILIPTEIWNYSSGKYIKKENSKHDFSPNPYTIGLDIDINELLNQDFRDQLYQIKNAYSEQINNDLNIVRGPMACGSAVVANDKVVDELIKKHQRKTIGLDMESYGMFYAATHTRKNCLPICIKSICDFADNNKSDSYQEYAAYTSASFIKYCIEKVLDF